MTNPKVSEERMLERINLELKSLGHELNEPLRKALPEWVESEKEIWQAIRAAIEERGRLRKLEKNVDEWKKRAEIIEMELFKDSEVQGAYELIVEIRDFKLDGEGAAHD